MIPFIDVYFDFRTEKPIYFQNELLFEGRREDMMQFTKAVESCIIFAQEFRHKKGFHERLRTEHIFFALLYAVTYRSFDQPICQAEMDMVEKLILSNVSDVEQAMEFIFENKISDSIEYQDALIALHRAAEIAERQRSPLTLPILAKAVLEQRIHSSVIEQACNATPFSNQRLSMENLEFFDVPPPPTRISNILFYFVYFLIPLILMGISVSKHSFLLRAAAACFSLILLIRGVILHDDRSDSKESQDPWIVYGKRKGTAKHIFFQLFVRSLIPFLFVYELIVLFDIQLSIWAERIIWCYIFLWAWSMIYHWLRCRLLHLEALDEIRFSQENLCQFLTCIHFVLFPVEAIFLVYWLFNHFPIKGIHFVFMGIYVLLVSVIIIYASNKR